MVIEAGTDPELAEIRNSLNALTDAVYSLTRVSEKNTEHLERLRELAEKEPEGEPIQETLADILIELQSLPARVEQAMTRATRTTRPSGG